jgi:formylglycine-generating enzyme
MRLIACTLPLAALMVSAQAEPVRLDRFAIDSTEVSVREFRTFIAVRGKTEAEKSGGGYEFTTGWVKRQGWTWSSPQGRPANDDEPAVHVTWSEARDYCTWRKGRLPTLEEWRRAAFTELREGPSDGFSTGKQYTYPVGDRPEGMNTSSTDKWAHAAAVGETKRGVNGLYDMGGNVWEWLADRKGGEALTAGGSWWYGAEKARTEAVQWKLADFYAVYVGFRCAYDIDAAP